MIQFYPLVATNPGVYNIVGGSKTHLGRRYEAFSASRGSGSNGYSRQDCSTGFQGEGRLRSLVGIWCLANDLGTTSATNLSTICPPWELRERLEHTDSCVLHGKGKHHGARHDYTGNEYMKNVRQSGFCAHDARTYAGIICRGGQCQT